MASGDYTELLHDVLRENKVKRLCDLPIEALRGQIAEYQKLSGEIEERLEQGEGEDEVLLQEDYDALIERLEDHLERREAGTGEEDTDDDLA